jgi:hypothetical protein
MRNTKDRFNINLSKDRHSTENNQIKSFQTKNYGSENRENSSKIQQRSFNKSGGMKIRPTHDQGEINFTF